VTFLILRDNICQLGYVMLLFVTIQLIIQMYT